VLSSLVAALMAAVSLGGLLYPKAIYASDELLGSYLANDVANLFIGLPILLVATWRSRRGKLAGLLLWPGALLYVLYNYTAYLLGVPPGLITSAYLLLVLVSLYLLWVLLKNIRGHAVGEQLAESVPVKSAGWVLAVFGGLFLLRAIAVIAQASTSQTNLPSNEIGTLVADLVLSPLWIAGGVSLLRRKPFGYASGLGLLFAACTLFVGLIVWLLLGPVITGAPLALFDVLVVTLMGMICFIPFGLFLRGVVSKGS
jgi:hypothetical protein